MIQSISYNLTDEESTLLKVSAQKFKECSFFESLSIRSLIDPGASEYKLNLHDFPKTKEGEIQKIWYKLLHIISAFCNRIDFKALIHKNIEWMTRSAYNYNYYEKCVKRALAEYIIFLRTGFTDYGLECELVENMKIDDMVNLLNGELHLRTSFYKNKNKDEMIVEIATIHYDYDKIYEEYGIDQTRDYNPEDEDYPDYEKYIQYITKYKHTKRIINHRNMIASMWAR